MVFVSWNPQLWNMNENSPNLWSFLPAGCTRVQSSGQSEGVMVVGADPPPSCAGASPLWPTCAGDIPTHKDRLWPVQSPHGDGLCLFCPCWSPAGYGSLHNDMKLSVSVWIWSNMLIQNGTLIVPVIAYFIFFLQSRCFESLNVSLKNIINLSCIV